MMIDFVLLPAAFGAGVLGAGMGGVFAFVLTGLFAIVGGLIQAAVPVAGVAVHDNIGLSIIAFGTFLGPHCTFVGAVAATAYAARKGLISSGMNIYEPLCRLKSPMTLLVGGIWGLLGGMVVQLVGKIPVFSSLTDLPGTTVVVLAVLTRLIVGKCGLFGVYTGQQPRSWYLKEEELLTNLVIALGTSCAVSGTAAVLYSRGYGNVLGVFPVICFGISALMLLMIVFGKECPVTHHITLISGYGAVLGVSLWGVAGSAFGIVTGLVAELIAIGATTCLNSHVDTHIDPPACAIVAGALGTHILAWVLGAPLGSLWVGVMPM